MKTKILILMTVSIIFLTAHFLIVPVKGQTLSEDMEDNQLIIVEGKVDESYYEKDGYVIIQNNVNSLEVGSYEIVYQSLADGMLYTRYVEVISRDNKEYFNVDTCTIETFNDYPMILEKSVSLTKNEQILMVRYITDSDKNIGHLYMYYIKNNEIIKEILLFYNQKITVNDLLVDGDDFIIIGQIWNSLYANYDIVFVVCDKNGFRKCNKIIGGSQTDTGLTGTILDDSYLVVGVTDSIDQIFDGNKKTNGFVMKIDKTSYEAVNIEYHKEYLTAQDLKFVSHNGLKLLIINDYTICLSELNDVGKVIKEQKISFDTNINVLEVYGKNNEIKLILEKDNQVEIGILTSKGYEVFNTLNSSLKVKGIEFFNQMLNVLYEIEDGCKLEVYDEEFKKIYEKDIFNTFNNVDDLIMSGQAIIEPLLSTGKIKIHQLEYLKILTMGKLELLDDNYHDYQVVINGQKVSHNPYLTIDKVEGDTFGSYDVTYYFDSELDLIMSKNIKVNTTCEIVEGGIYDKGLIINHNGAMYLNNERIVSGYIIDEVGLYVLELVGKNNISKIINFEVQDLSLKPTIKEEQIEDLVDIKVLYSDYQKEELNYNFMETEISKTSQVNHQWDFMYMIPVLLTMGLGFIVVKFRY